MIKKNVNSRIAFVKTSLEYAIKFGSKKSNCE